MKYTSTRSNDICFTFEEALCMGYAPDGGLFIPEKLPSVSAQDLESWSHLSYCQLAEQILGLFVTELSSADIRDICQQAFSGFPETVVPIKALSSEFFVAELFHGPTFCFKDLAMRVVIGLLSHYASKRQERITLIVATTGDTGPAAVQAVADVQNSFLNLVVHYPDGAISSFQRKQLTTCKSPYVKVVAFEGGGDDMDLPIKNLLANPDDGVWTGVNSYNIGRPIAQIVHFVWTYLRVAERKGFTIGNPKDTVDIILPTGAMGNMTSGYMAKRMGVPIGMIHSGVNRNDITDRVIRTGAFHKSPVMHKTLSEAINIQIPYNFERILYYLTDDKELVRKWMTEVETRQELDLDTKWLKRLQAEFGSARVTDAEMCEVIRSTSSEYQYLIDPHTAVAFSAANKLGYSTTKKPREGQPVAALLSTASPCKFKESISVAVGEDGWKKYSTGTVFPASAIETISTEELAPAYYKAENSLAESQKIWELKTRKIVADLGQVPS